MWKRREKKKRKRKKKRKKREFKKRKKGGRYLGQQGLRWSIGKEGGVGGGGDSI